MNELMILEAPSGIGVADRGTYSHEKLIHPGLWNRLVTRIAEEERVPYAFAERIINEALKFIDFLGTVSRQVGPSPLVDIGWHAFILYTHDYTAFCESRYGRYIHHVPDDEPTIIQRSGTIGDTMRQMEDAGYPLDSALWTMEFAAEDDPRKLVALTVKGADCDGSGTVWCQHAQETTDG